MIAETLLDYTPLSGPDDNLYYARACGRQRDDGMWEGWIEFESTDGSAAYRTSRETTQPNHKDLLYWATGVTGVYLDGALARAISPRPVRLVTPPTPPVFDGPAEEALETERVDALIDPFGVYAKGETLLRRQLNALATWHLRNIARAYRMVTDPEEVEELGKGSLIELIVGAARAAASSVVRERNRAVGGVPDRAHRG